MLVLLCRVIFDLVDQERYIGWNHERCSGIVEFYLDEGEPEVLTVVITKEDKSFYDRVCFVDSDDADC